jgi:hypothetical protein
MMTQAVPILHDRNYYNGVKKIYAFTIQKSAIVALLTDIIA